MLHDDPERDFSNPYGDGNASARILESLTSWASADDDRQISSFVTAT